MKEDREEDAAKTLKKQLHCTHTHTVLLRTRTETGEARIREGMLSHFSQRSGFSLKDCGVKEVDCPFSCRIQGPNFRSSLGDGCLSGKVRS